jgi:multimeric flavodoxin WrbA
MMNVIGIIASPHKEGNTAWTVNQILEGAKEQGAETRSWNFSDHDIRPCQGCLCCHDGSDRGCILDDDMQELYEAIGQADAIVIGSPVYMGQMSAQAKIITDRLFAQISPRFSPHYKEKVTKQKLVLVFTQGNPDPGMFRVYFDYTKHIFQMLEFDVREVVVVPGMRERPAHERNDLPPVMLDIGASLVSERSPV